MKKPCPAFCAVLLAALAAGCSSKDDALYPSLAPRPIEKLVASESVTPPSPSRPTVPLDPAFEARLAELRQMAEAAGKALDDAVAEAGNPAPGAEPGSEPWVENQTALSRLDAAQAALRAVETDLGALRADTARARVAGAATAGVDDGLAALQRQIDAAVARGEAAIRARR